MSPFLKNIARSILKEPKRYFYDTGMVEGDERLKFENLVAASLLKHVYALNDYLGKPCTLNYLRTKDKAEVDFCIANKHFSELMIEVKRSDKNLGKAIINFNRRYNIPGVQFVLNLKHERKGINYLKSLML